MKIITISGLDGSGKSTQIEMLKNHLESLGKKVFYFHAIQFGIAQKLVNFKKKYCLICKIKGLCKIKKDGVTQESVTKSSWFGIQIRKIFLQIDIWRFEKLYKKLEKEGFDYILSDRFFHDSIINISYLENSKIKNQKLKIENLISFYLETNPEEIMKRERVPDQGLEYLKKKKELYDIKASDWNFKIINGNREKDIIFQEIKNLAH